MLEGHYSTEIYNALALVHVADTAVRGSGRFEPFLAQAGELFVAHGVEQFAGVFLLHRHNSLEAGTAMVEIGALRDGQPTLVTSPRPLAAGVGTPTRWALRDGAFCPIEFSDDPDLAGQRAELVSRPAFLAAFAALVRDHGFADLLGLCLFDRDYFHEDHAGMILVEETEMATSSNVVRWVSDIADKSGLIETVWHFIQPTPTKPKCVPTCTQYCIKRSPGHATSHEKAHIKVTGGNEDKIGRPARNTLN